MRIAEIPSRLGVSGAVGELQATSAEVRLSLHDRLLYATDASIYQVEPLAVVVPRSLEQGVAVMRVCAKHGLPILPRGSGTALAGQSVNRAVIIDFSQHCRGILNIESASRRATVEAGVVLDQLNAALAPHGLMFGPDVATSSHATIGGMIGNNSAGAYSILYGHTVESVRSVEVVLADGSVHKFHEGSCDGDEFQRGLARGLQSIVMPLAAEIRSRFPRIKRHVDGYNLDILLQQFEACTPGTFDRVNLAKLIVGSEGTLGTVLRAQLDLVHRPAHRALVIFGFNSVAEAIAVVPGILTTSPAAVELVDDVIISVAKANLEHSRYLEVLPRPARGELGAVLYVEHFGASAAEVRSKLEEVTRLLPDAPTRLCTDAASMSAAWKLRKAGEPLLHGIPGLRKPVTFVEDAAVDAQSLAEFVTEFRAIVERNGTTAAYYAHASVGCLHIRPLIYLRDAEDRQRLLNIATEVADLVVRFGGALSGEHGDGRLRSPLLSRVLGETICGALKQVKALFDPAGLMNPGNIVESDDPQRILTNLRISPNDQARAVVEPSSTFYSYEREGGFAHAVEQCNGAGICRRLTEGGTMCPSYRVLLDERHTTRGRANAMRLALSGQLGPAGFDERETAETLDLCLSCKACRSECPSNVDLAKLKSEFLAQRYARAGRVPFRERVFGNVRFSQRLGSALWPLSNMLLRFAPVAALARSLLDIAPARSFPKYSQSLLRLAKSGGGDHSASPTVVLFADCFTTFSESAIGLAAIEVLRRFGYRVEVVNAGCCGRSLISTGQLADALRTCARTATALDLAVTRTKARAVLVCEPSCASAMRDEWTQLRLGHALPAAKRIAAMTFLVEEWLHAEWESHPVRPQGMSSPSERVLLHAHCHQKALWGAESSAGLLARYFPQVTVIPSGCCGMAGAFGFASHRYELSMQIGEQVLFPAVRGAPDAIICAPGTSCRHQVHDGTSVSPLHPIEAIHRVLVDAP